MIVTLLTWLAKKKSFRQVDSIKREKGQFAQRGWMLGLLGKAAGRQPSRQNSNKPHHQESQGVKQPNAKCRPSHSLGVDFPRADTVIRDPGFTFCRYCRVLDVDQDLQVDQG